MKNHESKNKIEKNKTREQNKNKKEIEGKKNIQASYFTYFIFFKHGCKLSPSS